MNILKILFLSFQLFSIPAKADLLRIADHADFQYVSNLVKKELTSIDTIIIAIGGDNKEFTSTAGVFSENFIKKLDDVRENDLKLKLVLYNDEKHEYKEAIIIYII